MQRPRVTSRPAARLGYGPACPTALLSVTRCGENRRPNERRPRLLSRPASLALCGLTLSLSLSAQAEDRSHLIVIVSVDQLRPDYLDAWRPAFGARGLRRIMDEGVLCT